MKRILAVILTAALLASSLFMLFSCGEHGRTVTIAGNSIEFSASAGEFDTLAFEGMPVAGTASSGDAAKATFEYAPEAASVTFYPEDGGIPVEAPSARDGFTLSFTVPEVSGTCGVHIEYSTDGTLYNLYFRLEVN